MKRGQAFDTMMLVVSVIVAVAILAILLGFLDQIVLPGGNPTAAIADSLGGVVQKSYGFSEPKEVDFKTGSFITRREVIAKVNILPEEVAFSCSDSLICSSDTLAVKDSEIDVKRNLKAYVTACGDETKKDTPKYCVGIARQAESSREECRKKCDMKS